MRELLRQTVAALAAVHSRNVTHRNVKPENLLLSWDAPPPAAGILLNTPDVSQCCTSLT